MGNTHFHPMHRGYDEKHLFADPLMAVDSKCSNKFVFELAVGHMQELEKLLAPARKRSEMRPILAAIEQKIKVVLVALRGYYGCRTGFYDELLAVHPECVFQVRLKQRQETQLIKRLDDLQRESGQLIALSKIQTDYGYYWPLLRFNTLRFKGKAIIEDWYALESKVMQLTYNTVFQDDGNGD